MAERTRVALGNGAGANTSILTLTPDASWQAGDVAVGFLVWSTNGALQALPAGWTQDGATYQWSNASMAKVWKVLGSGDLSPTTHAFSIAAATRFVGEFTAFSSIDNADPIDATSEGTSTVGATTMDAPAVTTDGAAVIITAWGCRFNSAGNPTITAPGSHGAASASSTNQAGTTTQAAVAIATPTSQPGSAGTVGPYTATLSAASERPMAMQVALNVSSGDTAPANTTPAAITGTPQVDQTLTVAPGTWTGSPTPTVTRKWQRSDNGSTGWTDISAATGTTYVVQGADETKYLRVLESAVNTVSTVTQASNVVGAVTAAPALAFQIRQSGGASNTDFTASHGGAKSSAQVTLDPGLMGVSAGDSNTRTAKYWCFYLHNAEASRSFTAKAWFTEQPSGGQAWKVGAGAASAGSTETATADSVTAPASVTLASPSTEGGATSLGTIAPGQGKAFWIMRPADAALAAGLVAMELHIKLDEV